MKGEVLARTAGWTRGTLWRRWSTLLILASGRIDRRRVLWLRPACARCGKVAERRKGMVF